MKKYVYGYFDTVSEVYLKIVTTGDDPKSMCAGARAAARAGQIGHDCDELELRLLSEWDNETGIFTPLDHAIFVFRYVDYSRLADQFRPKESIDVREETIEDPGIQDGD